MLLGRSLFCFSLLSQYSFSVLLLITFPLDRCLAYYCTSNVLRTPRSSCLQGKSRKDKIGIET